MADHVAFYGTLMRSYAAHIGASCRPGVTGHTDALAFLGRCQIQGLLVDLGAFPGLVACDSPNAVAVGELYRVADRRVFDALDRYEGYRADDPAGSLYVRIRTRLLEPDIEAWVYVYNRAAAGAAPVLHGDWLAHITSTARLP